MPDDKQPPAPAKDGNDAPVETEESGAGYGNNAGTQGDPGGAKD